MPRFGGEPENHVAVSMAWDTFAGFMLTTKAHYEAWLAAWYAKRDEAGKPKTQPKREVAPAPQEPEYSAEPEYESMPMF